MKKTNKIYLLVFVSLVIIAIASTFTVAYFSHFKQVKMSSSLLDPKAENQTEKSNFEQEENLLEKAVKLVENTIGSNKSDDVRAQSETSTYYLHKNITATIFWVGEKASDENDNISNAPSAWDDEWKNHYGGVDNPNKRDGFYPSKFVPKENPFYVALPYNDFNTKGERKRKSLSIVPWANSKSWQDDESLCKNQWVMIIKDRRVAYAQWEDVGPFGENDSNYVFGKSLPKNDENKSAGIDLSPAVRDFLELEDIDKVDWKFVEGKDVPDGPWKKIVTKSTINW